MAAARAALEHGLAWRATLLLTPVLGDSSRRTPDVVLLAARAASRWQGWSEVRRLLSGAPWLDAEAGGAGRALLARAELELGDDTLALRDAATAVALAADDRARGARLVVLARAWDRLDSLPAAAERYLAAGRLLPEIAGWLRYRAVAVTGDSAARAALSTPIGLDAARDHLPEADAWAMERSGDWLGAARAWRALNRPAQAFGLRLRAAGTADSARGTVRDSMLALLALRPPASVARAVVAVLDSAFPTLPAAAQLTVGRALAPAGPAARAAAAFEAAFGAGLGEPRDRYDYAAQLAALGRYGDAATAFAGVGGAPSLAADAAYQRGRALVRAGDLARGRAALRTVLRQYPKETDPASTALFLLADLATDEGRDRAARNAFEQLARQYRGSRWAPEARFRAAIIAFAHRDYAGARAQLDLLIRRYPRDNEASAARYWLGRAWARLGNRARARAAWRDVATSDRAGYYGALAARRLGAEPWSPPAAADSFVPVPAVDSALARAALLDRLGLEREARWEVEAAARGADTSVERLLATAAAFRSADYGSRTVRLALRALGRGAAVDARTYRLLYPVLHEGALVSEARTHGLDPAWVAALIRQESTFNPEAESGAGARGLMQLLPDVGRRVARALSLPVWDPVLLYQPDVNLQLGTAWLADLKRQYPEHVETLAAYNAGRTRIDRWVTKAGTRDAELLVERIPYAETRDYVRIVERNEDFYRALYRWGPGGAAPASGGGP